MAAGHWNASWIRPLHELGARRRGGGRFSDRQATHRQDCKANVGLRSAEVNNLPPPPHSLSAAQVIRGNSVVQMEALDRVWNEEAAAAHAAATAAAAAAPAVA